VGEKGRVEGPDRESIVLKENRNTYNGENRREKRLHNKTSQFGVREMGGGHKKGGGTELIRNWP